MAAKKKTTEDERMAALEEEKKKADLVFVKKQKEFVIANLNKDLDRVNAEIQLLQGKKKNIEKNIATVKK